MSPTQPETAPGASFGGQPFAVDPAIKAGSRFLAALPLCEARLQDDARWPWIVLVPRRSGLVEISDLDAADRGRLMEEAMLAGEAVRAMGRVLGRPVDKLNLGALGNVTAQLHVHMVGRRRDDPAWPGPVWGVGVAEPYAAETLEVLRTAALGVLEAR